MAGAQSPPVEAKAGGRLGSRVSRMQCASGRHTEDPEWGAGATAGSAAAPRPRGTGHGATGPRYTGADVLGVVRTVRSVPREVTANPSSDSGSQSQADTGNRAAGGSPGAGASPRRALRPGLPGGASAASRPSGASSSVPSLPGLASLAPGGGGLASRWGLPLPDSWGSLLL